jgi:hypothetical protein
VLYFAANDVVHGRELWLYEPLPTVAGDYDLDDDVDGSDFLLWQRNLGATSTPAGSGADGDMTGVVDGGDLLVWSENFGTTGTAAGTISSRPADGNPRISAMSIALTDAAFASLSDPPGVIKPLGRQTSESLVNVEKFSSRRDKTDIGLVQRDTMPLTTPFVRMLAPRLIDQEGPHRLCSSSEEMPPAVPMLRFLGIDEPDVGLAHQ